MNGEEIASSGITYQVEHETACIQFPDKLPLGKVMILCPYLSVNTEL